MQVCAGVYRKGRGVLLLGGTATPSMLYVFQFGRHTYYTTCNVWWVLSVRADALGLTSATETEVFFHGAMNIV
jgi:hypothetical protein